MTNGARWLSGLTAATTLAVACSQGAANGSGNDNGESDGGAPADGGTQVLSSDASAIGSQDARSIVDAAAHARDAGDPSATPDGAAAPTCITPAAPQSCAPPVMTALPLCKLSQTGCMDATNPTRFAANAVYYEVNSPLWSDGAAKTRAFVMPDGGTIHVKNCAPDAGPAELAECASPGSAGAQADTGKWIFPVGTVLIKNFLFDGKLVETRLLMRVDPATANLIQNGSDWVGYNYAWNEQQTEATVLSGARTAVAFNTGKQTVAWDYPGFHDCIGCHAAAVGAIGPETAQMNRVVDGGNQIDTFVAKKLFDGTAPTKPYAAPTVEPYANAAVGLAGPPAGATLDQRARSYLSSNCGFCHRPDVNDQGFDLRYSLSLAETRLCNLSAETGIPGLTNQPPVDFAPGNHAASSLWVRMGIPVPATDPDENDDVGRMPPLGSFGVDQQGLDLMASWIDSVKTCPGADAGP